MAKLNEAKYIWMNGELVPWKDAKVHVLTHAFHYASGVFEGIRAYNTEKLGTAVFRLNEHVERLINSAKIYRMEIPYSHQDIKNAILETIRANGHESCYIRPIVYRGYHNLGVNPFECPVEITIATWEWGKYLGPEALLKGVDVMVSSWNKFGPNTLPAMAKATANYANSQLVKMEAVLNGYSEGILLNPDGTISEGSGENLFIVYKKVVYTPPLASSILPGITRDTIITILKDLGYEVKEQPIPREFLYIADEVFFSGTAAEITPIRSVDKIKVGNGDFPVVREVQKMFFALVDGKIEKYLHWLTPVYK